MPEVAEFRVVLTVPDFDKTVGFYRDALGLEQLADWSDEDGRVILLSAGRATLELFDQAQAEKVDAIEAGRRVWHLDCLESGPVGMQLTALHSEHRRDGARLVAAFRASRPRPCPIRGRLGV